ncbi:MAG: hypothetical protein PHX47_02555 [Candidatus ainarchaeum sp.]|jgi:hypothetical protein|nr:hypothetical protein [Candidatus ainarchaeum sp.]
MKTQTNENNLIEELFKFFEWITENKPTKEEKILIADYVMLGYGFKMVYESENIFKEILEELKIEVLK